MKITNKILIAVAVANARDTLVTEKCDKAQIARCAQGLCCVASASQYDMTTKALVGGPVTVTKVCLPDTKGEELNVYQDTQGTINPPLSLNTYWQYQCPASAAMRVMASLSAIAGSIYLLS